MFVDLVQQPSISLVHLSWGKYNCNSHHPFSLSSTLLFHQSLIPWKMFSLWDLSSSRIAKHMMQHFCISWVMSFLELPTEVYRIAKSCLYLPVKWLNIHEIYQIMLEWTVKQLTPCHMSAGFGYIRKKFICHVALVAQEFMNASFLNWCVRATTLQFFGFDYMLSSVKSYLMCMTCFFFPFSGYTQLGSYIS